MSRDAARVEGGKSSTTNDATRTLWTRSSVCATPECVSAPKAVDTAPQRGKIAAHGRGEGQYQAAVGLRSPLRRVLRDGPSRALVGRASRVRHARLAADRYRARRALPLRISALARRVRWRAPRDPRP